ncbi:MAG: FG-GAP repeat protein, partial [Lentisphaeria bacterium]|nr:FG-GAP repeat protein [Lentisphaeria bacterium]MBO5201654.1 FG-GAP repeat protein [Lentisphaeria bacterium]
SSLELAGIGDFNGDGKADILWQAADGGLHWGEAQAGKLNNLTTIA